MVVGRRGLPVTAEGSTALDFGHGSDHQSVVTADGAGDRLLREGSTPWASTRFTRHRPLRTEPRGLSKELSLGIRIAMTRFAAH